MIQKHEGHAPITLTMPPDFSEVQFRALAGLNKGVRIEKNKQGKLVIMSPTFGVYSCLSHVTFHQNLCQGVYEH